MEIIPVFDGKVISAGGFEVQVNADDRNRALGLVEYTSAVTEVVDEPTFSAARNAAAQLKAMLDEIEAAKKQSKLPFAAVERAIDGQAVRVGGPVKIEHTRVLGLLNAYVTGLEIARKAEQRREAEAKRIAQEKSDRELAAARAMLAETERKLREAQDETEAAKLREETTKRQNQLLQQQLAAELEADVEELGGFPERPAGLVPGGRVDHVYDFKLISVQQTCEARCFRLLRWELDIQACRDSVKSQLEGIPEMEPTLPGIQITKRINVSVKAASRIS